MYFKFKKVHRISGIVLTSFIGVHLFNHLVSVLGTSYHIELMNSLRLVYRNSIIETLLLIAIAIQVYTGLKLVFKKQKNTTKFFEKIQIWSGLYLAFFLLFHVGAVMFGRFVMQLDTNFYFGVAGLNTFPFNLFFVPYYGFALLSFFIHIATVHKLKMKNHFLGISPKNQSKIIVIVGLIITIIIFYGLTNGFKGVAIPSEYNLKIS